MIHKPGNLEAIFGRPFTGDGDIQDVPLDVQVKQAMLSAEIKAPDTIHFDGNLHRFSTKDGDPTDDSGWYVLFPDGIAAGRFGDWRTGQEQTFRANIGRILTSQEEMQIAMRHAEAQKRRAAETAKKRETAAEQVAKIWAEATPADDTHPYLARKGVKANGCRIGRDGRLIAPLYDRSGQLSSLQYISDDGAKRYHPGGATGARFWMIGIPGSRIYIAEGFATAATIYETTGAATVVAYSANNLEPAVGELRALYPTTEFVIVADNDASKVGQNHAEQAAAKHGATVIIPPELGDANDYAKAGHDLKGLLEPKKAEWLVNAEEMSLQPKPIKWLIKGYVQDESTMMIHGPSGCGKTFVVLDMALHVASGKEEWMGKKVKNGAVVYLAGEGHHGIRGRITAWKQVNRLPVSRMWVSSSALDINVPNSFQEVLTQIRSLPEVPRIIIIDTLHRFFNGDENSAQDSKSMIDACDLLKRTFNCCVILVHHTGVSELAQTRARGSSSWKGAMEIELSIRPEEDCIIIDPQKIKDAEMPEPIHVKLSSVTIHGWLDEDGEPVTSAVIEPAIVIAKAEKKKNDKELADQKVFKDLWILSGKDRKDDLPFVSFSAWKHFGKEYFGVSETTAKQYSKTTGNHALTRLVVCGSVSECDTGIIAINDDLVTICNLTL